MLEYQDNEKEMMEDSGLLYFPVARQLMFLKNAGMALERIIDLLFKHGCEKPSETIEFDVRGTFLHKALPPRDYKLLIKDVNESEEIFQEIRDFNKRENK